ncbi:hypothetical protein RM572_14810 [Streptomyces sp. DSM 42041]|uniref:Uncharacterized protein n=1 Tax=Streptomyces hazeniae TaxID=3075538 RepID=A0ABU2NU52_9ACTN|nr:hypothetical protein [Streptomyces sp. DSM 42041]MDT0380032.1 hypothetical protein [Streptomyces sp. DSM 42041]
MTVSLLVALGLVTGVAVAPAAVPEPRPAGSAAGRHDRLTNLAHLDFLRDSVTPPVQDGHSTYGPADEPIGVLWTYAEPDPDHPDGPYRRIGGGAYDEKTGTWSQGAFNADDVSRAAVVHLRHYRAHGDEHSRRAARDLLRGLTYLQTTTGPDAGNVVLWMQPDGTLNRSAEPKEEPDPSDSAPSYWLARTVWALGEGYAVLKDSDPDIARFLRERLLLAVDALDRQVLDPHYGTYLRADGRRVPAWLIADGADATGEALLGLSAYVEAAEDGSGDEVGEDGKDRAVRRALRRFARGVAEQSAGGTRTWPFGAVLPWAKSRTMWHGWGGLAPAGLARAADVLDDRTLLRPAVRDAASFTPHLLVAGGPDNGWLPTPGDRSQIAYGADSRVQTLLAVAGETGRPGLRAVAASAASWYFGANPAGARMYDPATGRTYDGVNADGTVNRNSGAESTVHGLLTMLALDDAPGVRDGARIARVTARETGRTVEAEDARPGEGARVVTPESAWTGESQWSGGAYVALADGGRLRVGAGEAGGQDRLVLPVVHRAENRTGGDTRWRDGDGRTLGTVRHDGAGAQGVTAVPGALEMVTLPRVLADGEAELTVTARSTGGAETRIDAVVLQPLVEHVVTASEDGRHGRALLRSFATDRRTVTLAVPGDSPATVSVHDASGRLVDRSHSRPGAEVRVTVAPGGFTVVTR